jgi:exonuclease V gamma subunit
MTEDELTNLSRTLSQLRESVAQWKTRYQEMVKTCCVTGAEREKILKEAESEIEFWKNRSINFEATLRTIRFIAVDSDIKQIASESLDKSHDL